MGSTKFLSLLVFLGVAFTRANAKAVPVGGASATVEGCVIDCFHGGYFQHPSDCSKFIQCAPTGPEILVCPQGTLWDQNRKICNFRDSIDCETGKYFTREGRPCPEAPTTREPTHAPTTPPPTQPPTEAPITDSPTEAPTTQPLTEAPTTKPPTEEPLTDPPTEAPITDPPTEAPITHLSTEPHPTQPPTEAPTTKPPTEAPLTDPPTEAPISDQPTEAPITHLSTEPHPTQPPTEAPTTQPPTAAPTEAPTPEEPDTQPPTEAPTPAEPDTHPPTEAGPTTVEPIIPTTPGECHFQCPKKFGKFPHPRDCNRFFTCRFWAPRESRCPFGLYFNDRINQCTIPSLSGCKASAEAQC